MQRKRTAVLTPSRRQGTVISSSVTPDGVTSDFEAALTLEPAELADNTLTLSLTLEGSYDGGQSWSTLAAGTWKGGGIKEGNPIVPHLGYQSGNRPDRVRLSLDIPRDLLCSADVVESEKGNDPRAV